MVGHGKHLTAALALAALLWLVPTARGQADELRTVPLDIVTAKGQTYRFTVEIADTAAAREHGLMGRTDLAARAGMLFEFPESDVVAFWMKDTPIPLDMLFIDKDGRIVHIAERTVPYDFTPISSLGPVTRVLEVNGGTSDQLGIHDGDKIVLPPAQP
jgi:uncharacterized membrane protein (UPF0127 family)